MRVRTILITVLAMALAAGLALAADVTGKWTGQRPGRDGNMVDVVYNFKADGNTLTGSTSMGQRDIQISDGKINGDNISFVTKVEFNGNSFVINYKGTVSGDEMKLTMQREGADQSRDFTLKRAK